MPASMYVLGHRNPDTDAICAAIGYTALLRAQGQAQAVAARQGPLRRETAWVLERFGVPAPLLVTDVRPRVADVMASPAATVRLDESLYEVSTVLQTRGVRALPVVDGDDRLHGIVRIEDFARVFVGGLELEALDHVQLDLDNVVRNLDGEVLVAAPERHLRDRVMVGAMEIDSMLKRIEPGILLVMGDRADAQRAAINAGVGALVITGDHPVLPDVIELARRQRVTIIKVPHHTFTTVRLIHMSTPIRHIMRTDVPTCHPDDLADDVRETLRGGSARSLVVVDDDERVVGLISRTNLLNPARRQLVLVDHNERGQAVAGIEEAEVMGVIDHHRVADFQTRTPPYMRLEPVGSTSTIVTKLFAEAQITPTAAIAGVLLSGIVADTLLFRGPTTTPEDRRVAATLESVAGISAAELGEKILTLASDVADRSAEDLLMTDFKEFNAEGRRFGIGVIETANGGAVLARREDLLATMATLREKGYASVLFAVIDILAERTTLLIDGYAEAVASTFETTPTDDETLVLPGILSRKKHIVPLLNALSRQIGSG